MYLVLRLDPDLFRSLESSVPDPQVFGPPWSRSLSSSKNLYKKNLEFYCFVTSLWLFIFKNDVNVPSKSNKQKKFSCCHEDHWRIRIRNTAWKARFGINHSRSRTLIADSGADPYNTKNLNKMTRKLKKTYRNFLLWSRRYSPVQPFCFF